MKNGKPEKEKIQKLINEFAKQRPAKQITMSQERAIHDFVYWMYLRKKFIIIPQGIYQKYIPE